MGELTAAAGERAARASAQADALREAVTAVPPGPDFAAALRGDAVAVIAELKRRSPSKGALNESIDAAGRAVAYVRGGARALSILTEPVRFGGALDDLRSARASVPVPLLRKDFLVASVQLLEARAHGASAVLLIARALPPAHVRDLALEAVALGLTPLIEVRSTAELGTALDVPQAVIGVNNRDLETLVIDPAVGTRLIPMVPPDRVAVYESGVQSAADVEMAAAAGADAVLVGSVLSLASDPVATVTALAGVPRRARA